MAEAGDMLREDTRIDSLPFLEIKEWVVGKREGKKKVSGCCCRSTNFILSVNFYPQRNPIES